MPFVLALLMLGPPLSWRALAISLFFVIAYSAPQLRFKEIPVLDSVTSSIHFCSPALYGIVVAGLVPDARPWMFLISFFLWGMASHAFGPSRTWSPIARRGSRRLQPSLAPHGPSVWRCSCGPLRAY